MDKTIDLRQALRAFQTIRELGEPERTSFKYRGVEAISDFDGYNICLQDDYVSLDIYFHSKYKLKFQNQQALLQFQEKLAIIEKQQKIRHTGSSQERHSSSHQRKTFP